MHDLSQFLVLVLQGSGKYLSFSHSLRGVVEVKWELTDNLEVLLVVTIQLQHLLELLARLRVFPLG